MEANLVYLKSDADISVVSNVIIPSFERIWF
jgi:hypothetical protein